MEAICQHSPFKSRETITEEFMTIKNGGTRVILYNLKLHQLDFKTDPNDIRIPADDG